MCESIKFSFSGQPRFVKDCVCENCRRAHGASAVCWAGFASSQFKIDSGESFLCWFKSSEEADRGFCSNCGTRFLFRSTRWTGEMHIAVACIDMPHNLSATDVSFVEELPKWTTMTST